MVFSTPYFLFLYLPIVLLIYYLVPLKLRNLVLLIFSLIFYGWGEPLYVFLMLFTIALDYLFGLVVGKNRENKKGKAALTELFNNAKNRSTPIIVERIVNEIDEIVKIVRFPGWKDTVQGRNDVIKALKSVFIKKRLFDTELFEKAYGYVEQYY